MNNNKQLNKGDKMRKITMIVGILSILAVNAANAGIWRHVPNYYGGGWTSTYQPTYNVWTGTFN